jgi:predicted porin
VFSSFRWDGYVSQAIINTSRNRFFGDSTRSISPDYREIQLLLSVNLLQQVQLSTSLLSRRAGGVDDGDPRIDHAFLSYNFLHDLDHSVGIRLGRIKAPVGLFGDTRDVSFVRPGILLPQSIYSERFRDPMFAFDGFELFGQRLWDISSLGWQVVVNFNEPDTGYFEDLLRYQISSDDIKVKPSGAVRTIYDWDAGRLRLAATYGLLQYEIDNANNPLALTPQLQSTDTEISTRALILSMEYNAQKWRLMGEYLHSSNEFRHTLSGLDTDSPGLSWYLQTTYRFNPKWEGILRYSTFYINKNDPDGSGFEQLIGMKQAELNALVAMNPGLLTIPEFAALYNQFTSQSIKGHSTYAKNWVVGLGWNISSTMLARLEYFIVDGTGWIPQSDVESSTENKRCWNMLMAQFSWRF